MARLIWLLGLLACGVAPAGAKEYLYDGWRVIYPVRYGTINGGARDQWASSPLRSQTAESHLSHGVKERDVSNTPTVSYTRGSDLSGTLQGAGGIGGLLGGSHGYSNGNWTNHNFYHADGNGNATYLVNAGQTLAAR